MSKVLSQDKGPTQPVQVIALSWPLQQWGNDIVGKLTPTQGNYTFVVVTVEYFTKWIEAKPLTNVTSASIKKIILVEDHLPLWRPQAYNSQQHKVL
jgi:hypothetical protein